MLIETLVVSPLSVNCYIISPGEGGEAAVIDPGDDGERIMEALGRKRLKLKCILLTHGHFDHFGAARELQEKTGAPVLFSEKDREFVENASEHAALFGMTASPAPRDCRYVREGDVIEVGDIPLRIIETPGHSPGGISIYAESAGAVFTGDTLFWGSIGRTDLPGSDHGALIDSLKRKLGSLPDGTKVYPGHFDDTSIGFEKEQNPFFE